MKIRAAIPMTILAAALAGAGAAQEPAKPAPGSVNGVVTLDGKPAPGVTLLLAREAFDPMAKPAGTATSDKDGVFRMDGVAPGRYTLYADAPALVADAASRAGGVTVLVGDGESLKNLSVRLRRGGVLTGRVTNADGEPLVAQQIFVFRAGEGGGFEPVAIYGIDSSMSVTDDRGIYRVYGLAPGTYVVAAGTPNDGTMVNFGGAGKRYARQYYPGVATEAEARRLEVTAGGETGGVDFTLGDRTQTYAISGRVLDAETGAPVTDVYCGFGPMKNGKFAGSFGYGAVPGPTGAYRLTGIAPGTYVAMATGQDRSDGYYSEPTPFEITSSDVEGVDIPMRRGGAISGVAIVEGKTGADLATELARLGVVARPPEADTGDGDVDALSSKWGRINADGTFSVDGIRPGRYVLDGVGATSGAHAMLVRVERDGAPTDEPIEVAARETVAGVRLVFAIGSGTLRGRVTFSGSLPAQRYTLVEIRPVGSRQVAGRANVEDDGAYVAEGVPPGEYVAQAVTRGYAADAGSIFRSNERRVTISGSERVEADFVVSARGDGGEP